MEKIEKLHLIYDKETKTFVEGHAMIDGVPTDLNDNDKIRAVLEQLRVQEHASTYKELEKNGKYNLVFNSPDRVALINESWNKVLDKYEKDQQKHEKVNTFILNKNEKYKDATDVEIDEEKSNTKKHLVVAGTAIALAAMIGVGAVAINHLNKKNNTVDPTTIGTEDDTITLKSYDKTIPASYEEFKNASYANDSQQQFFTDEMEWIENNVVTTNYNDEEVKLFLTPELATAFNVYFNTYDMQNNDILSVIGDYDTNDLGINAQQAMQIMRYSLGLDIKSSDDVIKPMLKDEVAQELYNKYLDMWVQYKNAEKSSEKKEIRNNFATALGEDFLASGDVDFAEHPSAVVVLQLFVPALQAEDIKLDLSKEAKDLLGFDDVDNSLQDQGCAYFDTKFDSFNEYRNQLNIEKVAADSSNTAIVATADSQEEYDRLYVESKYDLYTADTFEVREHLDHEAVIVPIMNDYLIQELDLNENYDMSNMVSLMEEVTTAHLLAMQDNQAFTPSTPSGGEKGDTMIITDNTPVTLTEEQVVEHKEEVEEAVQQSVQETGVYDATTPEKEAEVAEQVQQQVTVQAQSVYDITYAYFVNQAGYSGGNSSGYDASWKTSTDGKVAQAYALAVADANSYITAMNANGGKTHNESTTTTTTSTPANNVPDGYAGNHSQNENQNGTSVVTPEISETVSDPTNTTPLPGNVTVETTTTSTPADTTIPDHNDNPNQKETETATITTTSTTTVESNVIAGTETYDSTGAVDMSQFGEIQSYDLSEEDYAAAADAIIEAQANSEATNDDTYTYSK